MSVGSLSLKLFFTNKRGANSNLIASFVAQYCRIEQERQESLLIINSSYYLHFRSSLSHTLRSIFPSSINTPGSPQPTLSNFTHSPPLFSTCTVDIPAWLNCNTRSFAAGWDLDSLVCFNFRDVQSVTGIELEGWLCALYL